MFFQLTIYLYIHPKKGALSSIFPILGNGRKSLLVEQFKASHPIHFEKLIRNAVFPKIKLILKEDTVRLYQVSGGIVNFMEENMLIKGIKNSFPQRVKFHGYG